MKYRNISNQTQTLIGFGVVEPNAVIETENEINNPNFKLVVNEPFKAKDPEEVGVKQYGRSKSHRKTS